MLMLGSHNGAAQEERITGDMNNNRGFQGGWVIEVGEDEQMQGDINVQPAETTQSQVAEPVRQGGAGIEMIIGGQGNGGVAKKGTLPVVD